MESKDAVQDVANDDLVNQIAELEKYERESSKNVLAFND